MPQDLTEDKSTLCPRGIFIIFELLDLFDNVYIYFVISEQL